MKKAKWLDLQLFGGEGGGAASGGASASSGGEAMGGTAETGGNAADAEQQRLRELGVPEDKLKRRAQRNASRRPETAFRNTVAVAESVSNNVQAAAAEEEPKEEAETNEETAPAVKRLTWDEIMADPEYNAEMQKTMSSRLKKSKAAEENLSKLAPTLEVLARKYSLDPNNLDYDALNKAVSEGDDYYEQKALEMGVSVETARKFEEQERELERRRSEDQRREAEEAQTLEQQKISDHFKKLENEGKTLKETFPTFDLQKELKNPVFRRMTSPNIGISVEDAYYAVHRKEIQTATAQATAQKTAEKLSNAIRSGSQRPAEAGTSSQAPSATTFDYSKASREQREALKREIRAAASRGEKVYPGGFTRK